MGKQSRAAEGSWGLWMKGLVTCLSHTRCAGRLRFIAAFVLAGMVQGTGLVHSEDLPLQHTRWPHKVFNAAYRLIASPEEWRTIDSLIDDGRQRYLDLFWKQRDPTPTTTPNEFKEQFTRRVDLARTRYSTHAQPEPWDHRGEIYIRFGPPDDLIDSLFDRYYEKWYYFGHNLKFMFTGGAQGLKLSPFHEFSGEVQALPDYYLQRGRTVDKGVVYEPPPGEINIDMALTWYPFRRFDGQYDVYFATGIPIKSIIKRARGRGGELDYITRIMVFDSLLHTQWSDSVFVRQSFERWPRKTILLAQWSALMPPGFYVVAAEVTDHQSRKRAAFAFDEILVPYEHNAELDLSPLVIAAEIRNATDESGPFVRHGKEIIPRAGGVFLREDDVAFYHEVYNLTPDTAGLCHYDVVYTIFDHKGQHPKVLIDQSYTSDQRDTYQTGRISSQELGKGKYILEVKTTDRVSSTTRTALADLKIE